MAHPSRCTMSRAWAQQFVQNKTARTQRIDWERIKVEDLDHYNTFHTPDDELDANALLRGLDKIQRAGGSGKDEQAFLDQMGFEVPSEGEPAAQDNRYQVLFDCGFGDLLAHRAAAAEHESHLQAEIKLLKKECRNRLEHCERKIL